MPAINYVLLYCACGELRKIAPEKVFVNGASEFPRLNPLPCPKCKNQMRPAPEYGQPTYTGQLFYPPSAEVAWMA